MPRKPARACAYQGCPNLVRGAGRYCDTHRREVKARYDASRPSAARRGYGARWRKLRRMYLAAHPICVDPFQVHDGEVVAATDVDHIVSLRRGGTNQWGNLQALCHSCHSRKTVVEDGRWG